MGSPDHSWSVNLITKIGVTALTLYAGCSIANEVYSNQGDVYVSNLLNVGLLAAGIICGPTVGLAIGIGYFLWIITQGWERDTALTIKLIVWLMNWDWNMVWYLM